MALTRKHVFQCGKCDLLQSYACDMEEAAVGEIHYYHHTEDNKEPHSVEVSRNAKGEYSYSIKVYGRTPEEAKVLIQYQIPGLDEMLRKLKDSTLRIDPVMQEALDKVTTKVKGGDKE